MGELQLFCLERLFFTAYDRAYVKKQNMLRFKIKQLLEKKEFDDNRRITINELAEFTDINRMKLLRSL
ncbi:hypothetical protein A1355_12315 [Methylomonas koyamae]|uniref:Uncharacterized protein n=1 Tax=Methylomonas koyamae TaxID=702114 RepID=A0A177NA18_9GAMM|nr:hypothetical protein A1355_12315 [Methylomonas koyamae]